MSYGMMSLEILTANLTSTVVGVSVCVLVALFSYIIYALSIREKSFEEIIEEQKKRTLQEEMQQKLEKVKKDKEKKHKKWGKKTKEKPDQVIETVREVKAPVNKQSQTASDLPPEIEIVEPKEVITKKKVKPSPKQSNVPVVQAVNKDTESNEKIRKVSTESNPIVKEEKQESMAIKEKEKSKVESQKVTESKKPKMTEVEKTPPVETVAQTAVEASPVITSPTSSKKKKKVEQSDKAEDTARVTANKLIALIKENTLDDYENQMLIDALLNKQKEASGWKKTGDVQTTIAKKQLREKEAALEQEQRQKQAITLKFQQELTQEKSKASALERLLQEKIAQQQKEIQALTTRIKQGQDELATEKKVAQEKAQQLEKSAQEKADAAVKKFQEEKAQLMKTIKRLESESKTNDSTAELEKVKKAKDELQKVHTLLVDQHTGILSAHKSQMKELNAQLSDLKNNVQKYEKENVNLLKEIELLKKNAEEFEDTKNALEQELNAVGSSSKKDLEQLESLLEDTKHLCHELEKEKKKVAIKVEELLTQNQQMSENITYLQSENERLSAELAASNERVAGDGQEMLQQNGEMNGKVKEEEQNNIENEKTLLEKEHVIKKLYSEIADLNKELEQQKQKNNELREKNWKAMEALKSEEKTSEQKIKEIEKLADEKVKELEEKIRIAEANAEEAVRAKELSERLGQTEEKIETLQKESLSNYQKYESQLKQNSHLTNEVQQLQQLTDKLKSEVLHNETCSRNCLQRLFTSVTVDNSLPYEEWLSQFEEQAASTVEISLSSQDEVDELRVRLSAAEEERNSLGQKSTEYANCLAETEGLLTKLQESAKNQELLFFEKLKAKEVDLENALKELEILRNEKEELHSRIQQLDQLQDQHLDVQRTLETSQHEKSLLEQKYEEVNKNYINLKDLVDSKDNQISELQKEISSVDNLKKEIEDIRTKLEKEKKINKDFSAQMVKLNSLVKIGQDALQAEQEHVKKLESQLQAEKLATANGTSSSSPTITTENELQAKQLEKKSSKKSKKSDGSVKK